MAGGGSPPDFGKTRAVINRLARNTNMDGCLFCGKKGITLFRINAKGQPGVWACAEHIGNTDASVDEGTRKIVEALDPRAARKLTRS